MIVLTLTLNDTQIKFVELTLADIERLDRKSNEDEKQEAPLKPASSTKSNPMKRPPTQEVENTLKKTKQNNRNI